MPGRKRRSTTKLSNLKQERSSIALLDSPELGVKRNEGDDVSKKPSKTSPPPEFKNALGVNDHDTATRLVAQALLTIPHAIQDVQTHQNFILTLLRGIGPKDVPEALLAVSMVGVYQTAMEFLARAAASNNSEATDRNVNRVSKLMRTCVALLEALNHHRRKLPQPMVVGNVNIADGGQAIVGSVNHPGSGKVSKDDEEKKVG